MAYLKMLRLLLGGFFKVTTVVQSSCYSETEGDISSVILKIQWWVDV